MIHEVTPEQLEHIDHGILTPTMRKLLDALGNNGLIIEWHPVIDQPNTVTVIWPDESASILTAEPTLDPYKMEN